MEFHHYKDEDCRGRIERVEYEAVNAAGEAITKYANVYLPYGYTPDQKYNILYTIHGGGGSPDAWLDTCQVKNMLDLSFVSGRAIPCIVVFPTYYVGSPRKARAEGVPVDWENTQIFQFQKELHDILIPAIETRYSTYLEENTPEGLRASRWHRAITGFSMGGGTTWYAFLENMDAIANFLPLSGDCWILESRGGMTRTAETVQCMIDRVQAQGFGKDDFKVYAATGTKDIAFPALDPMIAEMRKHTELFDFREDLTEGNLHYELTPDAPHTYEDVYQHLYNFLPVLFRGQEL